MLKIVPTCLGQVFWENEVKCVASRPFALPSPRKIRHKEKRKIGIYNSEILRRWLYPHIIYISTHHHYSKLEPISVTINVAYKCILFLKMNSIYNYLFFPFFLFYFYYYLERLHATVTDMNWNVNADTILCIVSGANILPEYSVLQYFCNC